MLKAMWRYRCPKHLSGELKVLHHVKIVRLNLSTCPLACGWCVVVKELWVLRIPQTSKKHFDVNGFPLSMVRSVEGP